jgi:hypothetical protein
MFALKQGVKRPITLFNNQALIVVHAQPFNSFFESIFGKKKVEKVPETPVKKEEAK